MRAEEAAITGPAPERGIWRVLLRWLRVPEAPPELPSGSPEAVKVFLPAPGYLRYLRCEALVTAVLIAAAFALAGLVLLLVGKAVICWLLLGVACAFLLAGALLALLARLRWRMMWYALGERALRARHGLWTIREVTITYENVQNVEVAQGPLMRLFGIWKLDIMTAGGASRGAGGGNPLLTVLLVAIQIVASFAPGGAAAGGALAGGGSRAAKQGARATGTVYGLLDPLPVRNHIMEKVRRSRSAGLGDEGAGHERAAEWAGRAVTREHVAALRSILDRLGA
ncbi:MAG: PH domain-containing protein [Planctomycetota bacterium]|jgi:membrane protein YdbS with pleckstrin-like domain